ncbi:MAG: phytanoyl-CoA dioxygenase family protein [Brevundimonas sp.]
MRSDGAAIVERAIDVDTVRRVLEEMAPHLDTVAPGTDDFTGRNTRRAGSLIARSRAAHTLATHPTVLGVCDDILGANSSSYQLHLTQVIDIGPGESAQFLHRDQWAWDQFPFPVGFDVEISTIWAMQDFTEANGATRVIPGSNMWAPERGFDANETVAAEMPAGSVLIYSGSVVHGGGANQTESRRVAVNIDYSLGWLRQEENQYLSCPPDVAAALPIELARLVGYSRASYALGYFGDTQDPIEALGATAGRGFAEPMSSP